MCETHACRHRHPEAASVPEQFRHRWEMPMIWLSVVITMLAFLLALAIIGVDTQGGLEELGEEAAELRDTAYILMLLPVAPLLIFLYRFYLAAQSRANAIRVGPDQFGAIHALYCDLAQRLGMARVPALYIINGNGTVNAFALECNSRRRYVVLHAEIALLHDSAPDVVEFVLAHELAHHRLRHVSLWRIVVGLVPNVLMLPGLATTRAQEYSADRLAMAVCPNHANAMRLLSVGPWMEKGVNPEAWLRQCEEERGEWAVRAVNAMSSHAVMVKRYKALRDIETHGFDRHGEMF